MGHRARNRDPGHAERSFSRAGRRVKGARGRGSGQRKGHPDYTLYILGAFIGPLYGVLIADYSLVERRQIDVDALYTLAPTGRYHIRSGYNPIAIAATAVGAVLAMLLVLMGSSDVAAFSWFLGAGTAFGAHRG